MPSSFEKQKLLADVLHNEDHEQFRRDLLKLTRQEFRRVRRSRPNRALPWLALAATLLLGIYLGHNWIPQGTGNDALATATPPPQPSMVENTSSANPVEKPGKVLPNNPASIPESVPPPLAEPEPAFAIVQTAPLADTAVVRSVARKNITVSTDPRGLPSHLVVHTTQPAETLTDDQLLALFPNRPAGFIHLPTDGKLFVLGPPRS